MQENAIMDPAIATQQREAREAAYRLALWEYLSSKNASTAFSDVSYRDGFATLRTHTGIRIELALASYDANQPIRVSVGRRSKRDRRWPLDGFTARLHKAALALDKERREERETQAEQARKAAERRAAFEAAVTPELLSWATESAYTNDAFDGSYCDDDGDAGVTFVRLSYAQLRAILTAARKVCGEGERS